MSKRQFWQQLESAPVGQELAVEQLLEQLNLDSAGLIPAIAQQAQTGEVLMLAWMNAESLAISLAEGRACYWSRSRQQLWRKGESSGQVQWLKNIKVDCDGDSLLLEVDQQGPACHTGRKSCFYVGLTAKAGTPAQVLTAPLISPDELYS